MPDNMDIKDLLSQYLALQNDPEYTGMQNKNAIDESDLQRLQQVPKQFGQNIPAQLAAGAAINQLGTLQGKTAPLAGLAAYSQIPQPKPPTVMQTTPAQSLGLDPKVLEYLKTGSQVQNALSPQDQLDQAAAKSANQTAGQKALLDYKAGLAKNSLGDKQQMQIDQENRQLKNKNQFAVDSAFIKDKNQYEQDLPARNQDIQGLATAVNILNSDPAMTGGVNGALPEVLSSRTNPQAKIAKDNVKKSIKNMFKQVLGGQFTEKEGQSLESVFFDPNLPPKDNVDKIKSLMQQLLDYNQLMKDKINYYNQNHTLQGYNDKNIENLHNQIQATAQKYGWQPNGAQAAPQSSAPHTPMPSTGSNPSMQPAGSSQPIEVPDPDNPGATMRLRPNGSGGWEEE